MAKPSRSSFATGAQQATSRVKKQSTLQNLARQTVGESSTGSAKVTSATQTKQASTRQFTPSSSNNNTRVTTNSSTRRARKRRRENSRNPSLTKTSSSLPTVVKQVAELCKGKKRLASEAFPETDDAIPCGICFEEQFELQGRLNSCKHVFCYDCIKTWASKSNQCPQCKQRFTLLQTVLKGALKKPIKSEVVGHKEFGVTLEQETRAQLQAVDMASNFDHSSLLEILQVVLDGRPMPVSINHAIHAAAAAAASPIEQQGHFPNRYQQQHFRNPSIRQDPMVTQTPQYFNADGQGMFLPFGANGTAYTTSARVFTNQQSQVQVVHIPVPPQQTMITPSIVTQQAQPWMMRSSWYCEVCRNQNVGWCQACGSRSFMALPQQQVPSNNLLPSTSVMYSMAAGPVPQANQILYVNDGQQHMG